MRFYPQPHPWYCGIALHARTMDVCRLNHDGASLVHRARQASPETVGKVMAPSREERGVAVACILTWYGRAALGAPAGLPFGLGHAW
jgi:hypothetical protein